MDRHRAGSRPPTEIDALVASLKGSARRSASTPKPTASITIRSSSASSRWRTTGGGATWSIHSRCPRWSPLGPFFADPGVIKVLHAADNDLGYLKRLYGFTVSNPLRHGASPRASSASPRCRLDGLLRDFLGRGPGPLAAEGRLVPAAALRRAGDLCPQRRAAPDPPARAAPRRAARQGARSAGSRRSARRSRPCRLPEQGGRPRRLHASSRAPRISTAAGLAVLRELVQMRETLASKAGSAARS